MSDGDGDPQHRSRVGPRPDRGQLAWSVFLGVSFCSGLRGEQAAGSRLQVIVIGVGGTLLLNLLRVAAVAALEATWGHLPALIFHDYGGTILVIVWLFAFWFAVQRWILAPAASDDLETMTS